MKFRGRHLHDRIETQMAPMIDVVFQLLIFFMLTLKIIEPEGDFNINMPIGVPAEQTSDVPPTLMKVRLIADPKSGQLAEMRFGQQTFGNGAEAFARLNSEVLRLVSMNVAEPPSKDHEVEIDADFDLNYQYVIKAVSAVTGRMDDGKLIRYIEKIRFAPPREPAG